MNQLSTAWVDITQSVRHYKLAFFLGWRDSILRYRVAKIGPLWMMIQTALWVGAICFFFGPSIGKNDPQYYIYVAVGISLYSTFLIFISEGVSVFIREASLILNVPNPFFIYVLKIAVKAIIQIIMTIPVIATVMLIAGKPLTSTSLLVMPGLVLCVLFGIGVTLLLGTLGARYRDIIFATHALMRLMLFITPIFWIVTQKTGLRTLIAEINPLYHLITVVRQPLLGILPASHHWYIATGSVIAALALGILIFSWYRGRIAIWL